MSKDPMFSVITPVYNRANFISRCYHNLLLQTYKDWEWVVVDDGSTDETKKEIEMISDERIQLISYKPNKGRGFARTRALNESKGKWIVIWDVDDINFPDRLAKIHNAKQDGYDFFCSYAVVVDNKFNIKGVRGFYPGSYGLQRSFVHPTLACRAEIAKEIGYKPTIRTGEDAKILWTLSLKYKGLYFDDALTIYHEDTEVNLRKAIESNLGQLSNLKELFREGILGGGKNRIFLCARIYLKIMALNLMRLYPSFYFRLVNKRYYGEIKPNWKLSKERIDFINSLKK